MRVLLILLCVCLFLPNSTAISFAASRVEAISAISVAEQRIKVCYEAVADAGKAGANVTYLLGVLDDAGTLLSKAYLAYEKRDFSGAQNLAVLCQQRLDGFDAQAGSLSDVASNERFWDFIVNVVGSVVGAFAVMASSFGVWTLLKRRLGKT